MAEGVAVGGKVLAGGVLDDPESPPPPSAVAPKGWTWDRTARAWKPKVRGKNAWLPPGGEPAAEDKGLPWFQKKDFPQQEDTPPPAEDEGRDPAPAWMSQEPDAKPGPGKIRLEDIPQAVKDDIAGLGGLVATPILALAKSVDPYCGGALADSFADVMDATLPLICRSEKIVKYFTEDTNDWILWGKVALALAPIGKAIAEHHIFHTVEVRRNETTGEVTILRATAGPDGQHLTPPAQPEYDPAQYAA